MPVKQTEELRMKFNHEFTFGGDGITLDITNADILWKWVKENFTPKTEAEVSGKFTAEEETIIKALLVSKMMEFKQALRDDIFFDDIEEQRLNTQLDIMYIIVDKLSRKEKQ